MTLFMRVVRLEVGSVRFDESGARLRREEENARGSRRRRIWKRRYAGSIVAGSSRPQRCCYPSLCMSLRGSRILIRSMRFSHARASFISVILDL